MIYPQGCSHAAGGASGLRDQGIESLIGGRKAPVVQLVEFQGLLDPLELDPGVADLCLVELARDADGEGGHEHAHDHDDRHDLDQGEAAASAVWRSRVLRGGRCVSCIEALQGRIWRVGQFGPTGLKREDSRG